MPYDATYRGVVIDTADPAGNSRIQVQVPELSTDHHWATAEQPGATPPGVGDEVTVHFQNGDENYPLWSPGAPPAGPAAPAGHHATYRGSVLDNHDPAGYRRVAVHVPDVSTETMWAMPEQQDAPLPAVGDEVSVRFHDGSLEHPLWSGGSGTGEAARLDGVHRASVVNNLDPAGLGRLYVHVPGVTEGVWASPEHPPPAVGEDVSVRFENGSAEHAVWSR